MSGERYVPAAGRGWLTRLYDPAMAATMREQRWRPRLVQAVLAGLPAGGRVIDVGTGTGALALRLASAGAAVTGVDGDEAVLALARRKPGAERVSWSTGLATALPLEDASADRVVMSLLLHHLTDADKQRALEEARRVLRPGGRLHVADWGRPRGSLPRAGFAALRLLDGRENTRAHAAGQLADAIRAAGLPDARVGYRLGTTWGTLELIAATRP
ncbi:MAG TPA: methyltransferase domain-containing protein [Capillimicrobium sp.]|nr:methyltransferase domain-containing protein [Capillimicrobium sp.]